MKKHMKLTAAALAAAMAFSMTAANIADEEKLDKIFKLYDPVLNISLVIVIISLGIPLDYRLIAGAGLKGVRLGGAEISRVHANFIVNVGGGSARDFLRLAELARARVEELFGIRLENEFEHLSDDLPF